MMDVDGNEERLFLRKLDLRCVSLQKTGRHLEALALMEQGVESRRFAFGEHAGETAAAEEKLCLLYNSIAMSALYKDEYDFALELLRKAEAVSGASRPLAAVRVQTLNNLACVYRRLDKPRTALNLLRESVTVCSNTGVEDGVAVTHLNMCAILSQLDSHEQALEHAQAAVMYSQKHLLSSRLRDQLARRSDGSGGAGAGDEDVFGADPHAVLTEKIVVLGIAYHNMGVEEEFLKRGDRCLQWYYKALQLANEHLGNDEELTTTFRESYLAAKKQVARRERRAVGDQLMRDKQARFGK
jgi:tetratricopeptide (TPR) repeat protein